MGTEEPLYWQLSTHHHTSLSWAILRDAWKAVRAICETRQGCWQHLTTIMMMHTVLANKAWERKISNPNERTLFSRLFSEALAWRISGKGGRELGLWKDTKRTLKKKSKMENLSSISFLVHYRQIWLSIILTQRNENYWSGFKEA